jgi:hypothetical protein
MNNCHLLKHNELPFIFHSSAIKNQIIKNFKILLLAINLQKTNFILKLFPMPMYLYNWLIKKLILIFMKKYLNQIIF